MDQRGGLKLFPRIFFPFILLANCGFRRISGIVRGTGDKLGYSISEDQIAYKNKPKQFSVRQMVWPVNGAIFENKKYTHPQVKSDETTRIFTDQIWSGRTKFDNSWPRLTKVSNMMKINQVRSEMIKRSKLTHSTRNDQICPNLNSVTGANH